MGQVLTACHEIVSDWKVSRTGRWYGLKEELRAFDLLEASSTTTTWDSVSCEALHLCEQSSSLWSLLNAARHLPRC